jgi:hypothetical protein
MQALAPRHDRLKPLQSAFVEQGGEQGAAWLAIGLAR